MRSKIRRISRTKIRRTIMPALSPRSARLFLLCLALHLGRPSVHSFAFERHEGKSFVFLYRETTFYVPLACHGASCASFFCSLMTHFILSSKCICHPERSEGSRVHKRGCSRDSSSLRSSEWQECLGDLFNKNNNNKITYLSWRKFSLWESWGCFS